MGAVPKNVTDRRVVDQENDDHLCDDASRDQLVAEER